MGELARQIICGGDFGSDQAEPQPGGGVFQALEAAVVGRTAQAENSDFPDLRGSLFEHLKLLLGGLISPDCDPGQIPPGTCQSRRKTGRQRITHPAITMGIEDVISRAAWVAS